MMLTVTGGKERTVREHDKLLASAGFRMTKSIPLSNDVIILEAEPVGSVDQIAEVSPR